MTSNTEEGKYYRKAIDDCKEDLDGDDGVYEAGEQLASQDCMFFDEFGEVVETGCWQSSVTGMNPTVRYETHRSRE